METEGFVTDTLSLGDSKFMVYESESALSCYWMPFLLQSMHNQRKLCSTCEHAANDFGLVDVL